MSSKGQYARRTVDIKQVHTNLEQEIIQITEDKLRLILNEHAQYLGKKNSWVAPASILITLMVVFSTTNFKKAYFSADTWEAVFIITTLLTSAWLLNSVYACFNARSISDIICKIKNSES